MREPRPLSPTPIVEVPLPRAPLARVIAQVRFPAYPGDPGSRTRWPSSRKRFARPTPISTEFRLTELISRQVSRRTSSRSSSGALADREQNPRWQVSLGVDFVGPRYLGL